MTKRLVINTLLTISVLFVGTGCSTKISSFPVTDDTERQGGIPYFIPKAMIQVKEPIEISRTEDLYAVLNVGGLDEFLFPLNNSTLDKSISSLEKLLKLGEGNLQVEGAKAKSVYLSKRNSKTTNKETEHKSDSTDNSEEFSILAVADKSKNESTSSTPYYKPSDIEKSISIIWIPDYTKEYELVINPSTFASSETSITLTDGWRLEAISSKTGENQIIKEISETLRTIIGAQKEIDVAKIGKDQAVKLKELELSEKEEKAFDYIPKQKLEVKIKGYVKKTNLNVIKPGIYDLSKILLTSSNGTVEFPTNTSVLWTKVEF